MFSCDPSLYTGPDITLGNFPPESIIEECFEFECIEHDNFETTLPAVGCCGISLSDSDLVSKATLPAAGCCGISLSDSDLVSKATLPAAGCCGASSHEFNVNLDSTLPAAGCCVSPSSAIDDKSRPTLPVLEYDEGPSPLKSSFCADYKGNSDTVTLPAAGCCDSPLVPNPFAQKNLPGFSLSGPKGNSYLPTTYIPDLCTLQICDRSSPPHLVGSQTSQMNLESWTHELSFENDVQLRDYLFYGIKETGSS